MAPPLDEAAAAELELLSAMFAEHEITLSGSSTANTVRCLLQPHSGGEAVHRIVEATLEATLVSSYPADPPALKLVATRGMVDEEEASLLRMLRTTAAESGGECCLYALLEQAREELRELSAKGDCPICRDPLFEGGGAPVLVPCGHSFHAPCLGYWWHTYKPPTAEATAPPDAAAASLAAARAADADAELIRRKAAEAEAVSHAAADRLAHLLEQFEPPPPPALVRRTKEELSTLEREAVQMRKRAERASVRAEEALRDASVVQSAQSDAQEAIPLPCPVCRMPIPVQDLHNTGVVMACPPLDETVARAPPISGGSPSCEVRHGGRSSALFDAELMGALGVQRVRQAHAEAAGPLERPRGPRVPSEKRMPRVPLRRQEAPAGMPPGMPRGSARDVASARSDAPAKVTATSVGMPAMASRASPTIPSSGMRGRGAGRGQARRGAGGKRGSSPSAAAPTRSSK